MKEKKILILKMAGIAIASISLSLGSWLLTKRFRTENAEVNFKKQLARDSKVLREEGPKSDSEYVGALIRLGSVKDNIAKEKAIQEVNSGATTYKNAAANTLANFDDDETITALAKLAQDRDGQIRGEAYRAIAHHFSEKRLAVFEQLLANKTLDREERIAIYLSIGNTPFAERLRSNGMQPLLKFASEVNHPSGIAIRAINAAAGIDPRNTTFVELLRKNIKPTGNVTISLLALHHLAAIQDPWLKDHLKDFISAKDLSLRLATLQSIHQLCPKNRWEILEWLVNPAQSGGNLTRVALDEVKLMPGSEAVAFIKRIQEKKYLQSPELFSYLQNLSSALSAPDLKDPCESSGQIKR